MSPTFYWIPYFKGKLLHYYQYFAFLGSSTVLLVALVSYLIYLQIRSCNQAKVDRFDTRRASVKTQKVLYKVTLICISLVPLICSATDTINLAFGILGMMFTLSYMVVTMNRVEGPEHPELGGNKAALAKAEQERNWRVKKQLLIVAAVSIVVPLFFHRTCLCFYNEEIGYYSHKLGFGINTMFTRMLMLDKACPPGPPCHLYTTLPEDSITSVFVNLHTHVDVENVTIHYKQIDATNSSSNFKVKATTYPYKGLDWVDQRTVHSALITDLKPSTKYLIRIQYDGKFWTNAVYRTLSDDPTVPIRMINAGDSGYTQAAIQLTRLMETLKPDVYFIGGDIAYDDNMPACAYTWDYYLKLYESLTTKLGYLMPIVLTVGNHDVGLNEMPGVNVTISEYGPPYILYFPQHYDRNDKFEIVKAIPPLNRRRTYFYHTFSNMQYISLDSGYVNTYSGLQQSFLVDSLELGKNLTRFVNYHVPMYSCCKSIEIDPQTFVYGMYHWIPSFDKYRVMTVFENHVHAFKRTKALRGNTPTENGTVYVGDGNFGAFLDEKCTPDKTIALFEKISSDNNLWLSIVDHKKVQHYAYNNSWVIMDQFVQMTAGYSLSQEDPLAGYSPPIE